jgi:hypothetical protein
MTNDKEREKAKQKNIAVIENAIAARNKVEKESVSLCFFFLGVFFCDIRARAQTSSFHFLCVFQKFLSLSLSLFLVVVIHQLRMLWSSATLSSKEKNR